jgi:hypothetical protein
MLFFQMSSTYNDLFKTIIVGEDVRELLKLKPKEELIQNLCQMTTLKEKKRSPWVQKSELK